LPQGNAIISPQSGRRIVGVEAEEKEMAESEGWLVVLERGKLGSRCWGPQSEERAKARAKHLGELHGCPFTIEWKRITVHASTYYDRG
jgi:hypothetical protein